MGVQTPSRKNEDGTSETNPSPEDWSNDSLPASTDGFQVSSVQPAAPTDALLQKASMKVPETPANEQSVLFATHQTTGILDLGASQTVMGRYQVDEFLELLPESVRCRVFEQPVDMSFRFGNNSVVPCRVALMVPVDRFWIKIAVVDTKTPFLISNNVCRSLGAVIDTTNQTICFRELDCTMPLTLSGKKLFLLDFSELVSLRPPRPAESDKTPMPQAENVCSCQSEESQFPSRVSHQDALKINTESLEVDREMSIQPDGDKPEEANSSSHVSSDRISTSGEAVAEVLRDQSHNQPTETSNSLPCASSHVLNQPCGSFRCRPGDAEQVEQGEDFDGLEHGRTPESHHQVRHCKGRTYLQGGGRDRSKVLSVVPSPMGSQQQERASGVPVLSEHVDGTQGIREWDQLFKGWRPTASEATTESRWQGSWRLLHGDADRPRDRRGAVGSGVHSRIPHATQDDEPHRPARECPDASCESAAKPDTSCRSGPVRLTQPAQTLMIDHVVEEYNAYMLGLGKEKYPVQRSSVVSSNWVFCEMMQYFSQHSHNPVNSRSSLDFLEVYCSADSRLTSQCQQQGLRALRFGLKQGDLNTYEGRCQLHKVLRSSPKHIWTSPKCKAWCKWSQFNANRSLEAAQRVCQAQEDDEVHLLLCAALFKLQAMRGDSFHFHLEQPVGSLMLGQECLQEVMDHAHCVRCDMCTAGKLTHPTMNLPLQKGTQIVTTSSILARYIQQFRCKNDHEHVPVAGSYVKNNGTHGRLSEYTELYTRMFCQRVARTICASLQVQELSTISQDMILGSMEEFSEAAAKRRRLNGKVSQPEGYPITTSPSVPEGNVENTSEASSSHDDSKPSKQMILDQALQLAPRVGKTVLEHGALFDVVQQAFPDHIVRVVELCKGADRFRKSPVKLIPHEAPLRMTLGIHRHSLEPFPDCQWEQWESLSMRQLCSKSPPARLLVTVFAREKSGIKRDHEDDPKDGQSPFCPSHAHKKLRDNSRGPDHSEDNSRESDQQPSRIPEIQTTSNNSDNFQEVATRPQPAADPNMQLKQSIVHHGPKFLSLPLQQRQWISKIHHNLGHPSNRKLQNVLQQQDVDPTIVQGVEVFRCSTCVELQEPKISRPASLPEPREFNDCVGCDLVTWTSRAGKQFQFLHMIDAATNFQIAAPIFRTDAESMFETMQDCWFHWAGPCQQLIVDNASPICSDQFAEYAPGQNIHLRVIAAFAHWQNGKTERHGDILQHMLEKFDVDREIKTDLEFRQALRLCCQAKNSLARSKGYTPEILVLGKSRKMPGSLCEDHADPAQYLADSDSPEGLAFRQHLEYRELARKAFVQTDNSDRLRRAFLRRQRPHRGHFASGAFVMFWRPGRGEIKGKWHGPARIIIQESENVIWISFSSRVYRVAPEHVRFLSEREAHQYSTTLEATNMSPPPKEMGKGVFQYEDLTGFQGVPPDNMNHANMPGNEMPLESSPAVDATPEAESQPDSEPCMPPASQADSEYTPTTPLHEETNDNPALKPEEVPVPEADDLMLEDVWVCQTDKILRIHNKPRFSAFDPSSCTDCPVDILHLSDTRVTTGTTPTGTVWLEHDIWGCPENAWCKDQPWTGVSVFIVVPDAGQAILSCEDVMHVSHDQVWSVKFF